MKNPLFDQFFPGEVLAYTSGRSLDFSLKKGQKDLTSEQKKFLADALSFKFSQAANIRQVHGNRVLHADRNGFFQKASLTEADGLITNVIDLALVVRTADCLPIFIFDSREKAIGLLHAGWRGSREGIVKEALERMRQSFSSKPENLKAAFGPAIRSCCYAVGKELQDYFPEETFLRDAKIYLDLIAVNKKQFLNFGVEEKNIFDCQRCTFCQPQYFSYRREGEKAGRMISLMVLRKRG